MPTPRTHTRRAARATAERERTPRKPGRWRRFIYGWWDRIFGAATSGGLSAASEEYEAGQTSKDFIWNSVGLACWGFMFPLFTIIVTQLLGAEAAGMFSLAFVTANVLMIVANYGIRPYQCSDLAERHSFKDYRVARWITCALMLVIGLVYCVIRGYAGEMLVMSVGIYVYRMLDGLADVYEGRLQQVDKLYLAGVSQALRSAVPLVVFTVLLFVTRSLQVSCIALALSAAAAFLFVTLPLALLETPKSPRASMASVSAILKGCFPLFIALFLYNFIDNMPKFAMDGVLEYSAQLYFNAMYFPAQMILMVGGLVYKPLIGRIAGVWNDESLRGRFHAFVAGMLAVVAVITVVVALLMEWVGIDLLGIMYAADFRSMHEMVMIMVVAGGLTGGIDFLYQVTAVIRHQKAITRIYAVAFVFSLVVPLALIHTMGLLGACVGYVAEMAFLFVVLLVEYIRVALGLAPTEFDPKPIMAKRK